jgi:hypothetical protein
MILDEVEICTTCSYLGRPVHSLPRHNNLRRMWIWYCNKCGNFWTGQHPVILSRRIRQQKFNVFLMKKLLEGEPHYDEYYGPGYMIDLNKWYCYNRAAHRWLKIMEERLSHER